MQTSGDALETVYDAFGGRFPERIGRYRLDGEIARGGMGDILKGLHTELGRELAIKVLLVAHKDEPHGSAPKGKHIVTGSFDRTAKVWDAETSQEVLALRGHTSFVYDVAFSPDGTWIVTGITGAHATAKGLVRQTGQRRVIRGLPLVHGIHMKSQ